MPKLTPPRYAPGDVVYSPGDHSIYAVVATDETGLVDLTWSREEVNQRRHQDSLRLLADPKRCGGLGALLRGQPAPAYTESPNA